MVFYTWRRMGVKPKTSAPDNQKYFPKMLPRAVQGTIGLFRIWQPFYSNLLNYGRNAKTNKSNRFIWFK